MSLLRSLFHKAAAPQDSLVVPADGPHVLEARGIVKRFGRKTVIRGVGFSMRSGEVVGLLGPNGAGKTTVFYTILGFVKPNEGAILLDNLDISRMPMYQRARLGVSYLPQEPSIFRRMTVEKNVWAILETRADLTLKEKKEKLDALLEEFGVRGIRFQPAYTLSGGERRRTEIARALAMEPKFLLLDEPFAGIDPIAVHEIKAIVLRLAEHGIGVLITDHNVRDTLEITNRAYIINLGEILVAGDRQTILDSEIARKIYLGEAFRM